MDSSAIDGTARPNIVLIVSDDHGYGDLSSLRDLDGLRTPNLDRLRASGVTFSRGYVSAPICSPSRAGLITGTHQARWGARWFDNSRFPPEPWAPGPETLRSLGYRTGYFGKVHYGPDTPGSRSCPENHGFDESLYGLAAQSMGRLHYLTHSRAEADEHPDVAKVHGTQPLYANGNEYETTTHLTELFANQAVDFIRRHSHGSAAPYFCMVAFNAVHNFTWQLPDDVLDQRGLPHHQDFDPDIDTYVDWYDGAVSPNLTHGREYYLAQLELMDRHIGRILDAVEATGSEDDTMVVYITDNGGSPCNYGDNTPLEGTKYTLLEGGIRVPYIVRWPGRTEAGGTSDALVSSLDLIPTFVAAASNGDFDPQAYDGIDLAPVLSGESPGHDALYFDTGVQQALVRPDVKWRRVTGEGPEMRQALLAIEHSDIGEGESVVRFTDGLAHPGEAAPVGSTATAAGDPELMALLRADFDRWQRSLG